jgi:hypothetical protein
MQQLGVDGIALRQQFVQVHGAHDRPDVGHGQVQDRPFQVAHLVGGAGGVDNLEEHHAVDLHQRVVLGDDLLGGDVQHRLHHVHFGADLVDHRDDQLQARREGAGIAAPTLHRVLHALGDGLDSHETDDDREQDHRDHENGETRYDGIHGGGSFPAR